MAFSLDKLVAFNQKLIQSTKKVIKSVMAKAPSDPVKIYDPSKKDKNGNPLIIGVEPIKLKPKMIDLDEPDALWNLKEIAENVDNFLVPFNLEVVVQLNNLYNEFNERLTALETRLMGAMATLQSNITNQMNQQSASLNNQLQQQKQQNSANSANVDAQISAINTTLSNINTNVNFMNTKITSLEKRVKDLEA